MKTYYKVLSILGMLSLFTQFLSANWIQREHKNSFVPQERSTPNTPVTQHSQATKSDSLPKDFTDEVMKGLLDENGNNIFPNEDPEGDALQRVIFNGLAGSAFGKLVSYAGDVNGDGYDDIIVGAPKYNASTGRAYIFTED